MVVLTLTGFSSGRHGSGGHHSGGGGGCSNSSQDHDSSSGSDSSGSDIDGSSTGDPYDDAYGGGPYGDSPSSAYSLGASTDGSDGDGGTRRSRPARRSTPTASPGGTARSLKDGTAVLVRCATTDVPFATVEVRNPNGREGVFTVRVTFQDDHGRTVSDGSDEVMVPAQGKVTGMVLVNHMDRVRDIAHCEVDPKATADR
ncbi:hypothetical protein [Streptomyces sp. NPDC048202]|uniref:hypothetical protein n=1 Tax=Streptomyces sp. NPDC048202 TaxID=3365514 RepID=UPI003719A8D6